VYGFPQVWSIFRFLNARKLGQAQKSAAVLRSPEKCLERAEKPMETLVSRLSDVAKMQSNAKYLHT